MYAIISTIVGLVVFIVLFRFTILTEEGKRESDIEKAFTLTFITIFSIGLGTIWPLIVIVFSIFYLCYVLARNIG